MYTMLVCSYHLFHKNEVRLLDAFSVETICRAYIHLSLRMRFVDFWRPAQIMISKIFDATFHIHICPSRTLASLNKDFICEQLSFKVQTKWKDLF